MADLDYYASYAEVRNLLNNQNVGSGTIYAEASMELALKISQALINLELGVDTLSCVSDVIVAEIAKGVQIDVIHQRILQAANLRFFATEADSSAVIGFWRQMTQLTREHRRILAICKSKNEGVAWAVNTRDGSVVI